MIMPRGQRLLLPANPLFIWGSLLFALVLNMLPLGRNPWLPDFLLLVLVFWIVHQPHRIGLGTAFVFGLVMDVHQLSLLGQHALTYTVLGFLVLLMRRRLHWFKPPAQSLQLLPLFIAAHALELMVRLLGGGVFPGWMLLLKPLLTTALWPVVALLLLIPQRRAHDPDADRPL